MGRLTKRFMHTMNRAIAANSKKPDHNSKAKVKYLYVTSQTSTQNISSLR